MRILHLGWGFRPWRVGGLIAYLEDLAEAQAAAGHDVAYLCTGRRFPGVPPRLQPWTRHGVQVFELINAPHPHGGDQGVLDPAIDLEEAVAEGAFRAVLNRFSPDVLHVHELAFPSSVLDIAHDRGLPTVMTTHDYATLCPTVKLFDADAANCRREHPGEMCRVCCAGAPDGHGHLVTQTLLHHTLRGERGRAAVRDAVGTLRDLPGTAAFVERVMPRLLPGTAGSEPPAPGEDAQRSAPAAAYDERRAVNVERLNRLDLLLANSTRVGELYAWHGVERERIRVVHLAPRHLAAIRPEPRTDAGTPLRFVTLNGCASVQKGAEVVADAVAALAELGYGGRYVLQVRGYVAPLVRPALLAHPEVRLEGSYATDELTALLADADVGIVPSAWEETFGFTGVECLAAGVPVIGNARGGITDYTIDGRSGWVNRTADGAGLAALMARLIDAPAEVTTLRRALRAARPPLVRSLDEHIDELDGVYAEVRASQRSTIASPAARRSSS